MRALRDAVTGAGFGVLGVLWLAELLLRRHDRVSAAPVDLADNLSAVEPSLPISPSKAVSRARLAVGAVGVAVATYGLVVVLRTVPWAGYGGIALWLAGAVILHDGVLVPAVSLLRLATHRVGGRLSSTTLALVTAAFVVGGVLSLIVLPEIWAKHLGPQNPSVLPGSYGQGLLVTWLVLGVLTVVSVAVRAASGRHRRRVPEPA